MDGRSEFLVMMGVALATATGLFVVQLWYATYLDVSVVHAQDPEAPMDGKLQEVRAAEQAKLAGGALPIEQAMKMIAERGRGASPKLMPQPSDDLSAMSGWAHQPGFKAYEPRKPQVVVPAPEAAALPVEGAQGAAPPAAAAEPASAAARPPVVKKVAVGVGAPAKGPAKRLIVAPAGPAAAPAAPPEKAP